MKYPLKYEELLAAFGKRYGEASDAAKGMFAEYVKAVNRAFEAGLKEGQKRQ